MVSKGASESTEFKVKNSQKYLLKVNLEAKSLTSGFDGP